MRKDVLLDEAAHLAVERCCVRHVGGALLVLDGEDAEGCARGRRVAHVTRMQRCAVRREPGPRVCPLPWASTPDLGGLGDFGHWWIAPIVFQKLAAWTLLWEILGLGSGSMQLTGRFSPLIGGVLYWLRPGTVRLPPWPDKVPVTKGYRRTVADVALYAGVLASAAYLLISGGEVQGARRLQPVAIIVLLSLWALLGLRDKVPFLAARPEVYGFILLVSLFPLRHAIAGWQFVLFFIWAGAAMSKLNRHFPFVVAVMVSNTPWNRSARAKE